MATLAAIVCLIPPALRPHISWAANGIPKHVEQSIPIQADSHARAITYATRGSTGKTMQELAVEVATSQHEAVVWHEALPGTVTRLVDEGPADVFTVFGTTANGDGFVGAYHVSARTVRSAIASDSSGLLTGDRGAVERPEGFVVLRADSAHTGEVPYRLRLRYGWSSGEYRELRVTRAPDLAASAYPTPNAVIHAASESTALLRLWVANDQISRDKGLMFIKNMDADQGMVFIWPQDVQESFWMENTYIPLTVAFVSAQGVILEMQDMAPLNADYHTPGESYRYAIEANQGYFARFGVKVGDRLTFHLG